MLIVIYVTAQIFCKLQGCKQDSLGRWFSTASEHFYRTCLPAREWYMFKLEKMATDFDRCQLCNGTYSYHLTMPADRHRLFQRILFGLVSKFLRVTGHRQLLAGSQVLFSQFSCIKQHF